MKTRGQQGSVLLVSLLVLLVLASIGLVVVQNVTLELGNMGTFRVMKQGYYVAEAGLTATLAQASVNQDMFMDFLASRAEQVDQAGLNAGYRVWMSDISPTFFDLSSWGSFGPEFGAAGSANFSTWFSDPVDTKRVPGYSTGAYCHRKYTVTADGYLGGNDLDADGSAAEATMHTAISRFTSHVYLGPFQCGN